jgi:hypothetical protein
VAAITERSAAGALAARRGSDARRSNGYSMQQSVGRDGKH